MIKNIQQLKKQVITTNHSFCFYIFISYVKKLRETYLIKMSKTLLVSFVNSKIRICNIDKYHIIDYISVLIL